MRTELRGLFSVAKPSQLLICFARGRLVLARRNIEAGPSCLGLAVAFFIVVGCGEPDGVEQVPVPDRDDSPVQTDALVYTLHPGLTNEEGGAYALATYTNETGSAVLFARCYDTDVGPIFNVERAAPDYGTHVVGPVWACVGGVEPGVVGVNERLVLEVPLGSSLEGGSPPITMRERTGLFRVTVDLYSSYDPGSDAGRKLPADQRVSNVFRIDEPTD